MPKTVSLSNAQFKGGDTLFFVAMMAQLQLWDGLITQAFVMRGLADESNRIAVHLLNEGNYMALKITGALISLALLLVIGRRYPDLAKVSASVICIFYLAVIAWNFLVVFNS